MWPAQTPDHKQLHPKRNKWITSNAYLLTITMLQMYLVQIVGDRLQNNGFVSKQSDFSSVCVFVCVCTNSAVFNLLQIYT